MHELKFRIEKYGRPVIWLGDEERRTVCLIDTGANMPVWFVGEVLLRERYPDAEPLKKKTILNGLGDKPIYDVPIWNIPEFILTDDNGNSIIYENLFISVINYFDFSIDMIIPLTMINRTKFSFDYLTSAVNATFTIAAEKNRFFVHPEYKEQNPDYMDKIQVFMQD